jgi:hypothetical protein
MVGQSINPIIQAILSDPESRNYKQVRDYLTWCTVRETLETMELTANLTPFERYELGWVFGLMDGTPGLMDALTDTLRSAMSNGLPIIFTWQPRRASCMVAVSVVGGQCFITLGTPKLDEDKLPAMFSGGYSGVLQGAVL